MKRFYIMLGDPTSVGGHVISGLESSTWHGKQTAWEGDEVECPACKSIGFIQCTGTGTRSTNRFNRIQALNGDLCICKCTPPPRLIAMQGTNGTSGVVDLKNYLCITPISEISPSPSFDLYFLVKNEITGTPLSNMPYRILLQSGKTFEGVTNEQGCTQRAHSNIPEQAKIEVPYYGNSATIFNTNNGSDTCSC